MKLHANARTCPNSRRLMVRRVEEEGWSLAAAAEADGVSERTAAKWLARYRAEGRPACAIEAQLRGVARLSFPPTGSRRSRPCARCG
jgi:DNA-directed RNA polymerase specialized sigma24 family protein